MLSTQSQPTHAVLVAFTVIVLPFRAAFISEFYRQLDMHHHLWQQLQVTPCIIHYSILTVVSACSCVQATCVILKTLSYSISDGLFGRVPVYGMQPNVLYGAWHHSASGSD